MWANTPAWQHAAPWWTLGDSWNRNQPAQANMNSNFFFQQMMMPQLQVAGVQTQMHQPQEVQNKGEGAAKAVVESQKAPSQKDDDRETAAWALMELNGKTSGTLLDLEGGAFHPSSSMKVAQKAASAAVVNTLKKRQNADETTSGGGYTGKRPPKKSKTLHNSAAKEDKPWMLKTPLADAKMPPKKLVWKDRYEQFLKIFSTGLTRNSGFAEVPGLNVWVNRQKRNYKDGVMSKEHFTILESAGFPFIKGRTWEQHYDLLTDFGEEYGHTTVPKRQPFTSSGLAEWTFLQRRLHKKGLLPEKCVKKLSEIGFQWK